MEKVSSIYKKIKDREIKIINENQARIALLKEMTRSMHDPVLKKQSEKIINLKQNYIKEVSKVIKKIK